MKKISVLILSSMILLLSFSAFLSCEKKSLNDKGVLYVALQGEDREGYDPTRGWGSYGNSLFHSTLLQYDNSLNIVHDLAKSMKVSKNRLVWELTIRKDARFSDGTFLTAKDVAYTFNEAKVSGGKVDLTMLDKAVAHGNHKITFYLNKPWLTFNHRLTTMGIVPQSIHEKNKKAYSRNPIGSGPYLMVSWKEGQHLMVKANPYFYGPKPAIKKIVFLFMNDDAAFAAAKAGKLHLVAIPHHFAKQKIKGMKIHPVQSVDNRGIVFPMIPDTGKKTPDGFPIGNNVTSDLSIRKALNYVIDRKLMVNKILEGYGEPAYGCVDNLPWDNKAIRIKDNDLDKALAILAQGGWKDRDGDGIVEKIVKTNAKNQTLKAEFTVIYFSNDIIRQYLALAFKDMAAKIGISVTVEGKSSEDVNRLKYSNAVLFGFGSHSPEEMYNLYHSKNHGKGFFNPGFYQNAKVDFCLDKAMSAPTLAKSIPWWQKAQWDQTTGLSLLGDAPWVWLVNLSHVYAVAENLDIGTSRIEPHGHGWPITANIIQWKWKQKNEN